MGIDWKSIIGDSLSTLFSEYIKPLLIPAILIIIGSVKIADFFNGNKRG